MSSVDFLQIRELFKGKFLVTPEAVQEKLFKIKAFIFDWDGVFNDGMKDENGNSPFSEVDSMGTNLLRFNYYLRKGQNPAVAVITGEKNGISFTFAQREHLNAIYYGIKHKKQAFTHFCATNNLAPHEVAFFFDDVLDFSVAELCGLRIMIGRNSSPLLENYAVKNSFVDYLTHNDGGHHAVREAVELLTGVSEHYDDTITNRVQYSDRYQQYLAERNSVRPTFYSLVDSNISEQPIK